MYTSVVERPNRKEIQHMAAKEKGAHLNYEDRKGIFARFEYQNAQKKERQLCIKVDVLRWRLR